MNKKEFIEAVTDNTDINKEAASVLVNRVFEVIKEQLASGEKIQIAGFGTFDVSERAARTVKNPFTGDNVDVAACKAPKFKPSKVLKDAINK